ncbi:hypothetical protein [Kribbella sp. NPDC006257]|uniref:hypothetical protein n=1 Tax=Kribbella sp. NPDC006257 TaxID=3156738 RepID=UPI0033A60040
MTNKQLPPASAIGPGFITQTTTFTVSLGSAFAFAIAASILVDIALQLNVWRVIGVSGRRAQELGNLVAPGVGSVMAGLLLAGGLVFNIGNVSGTGLLDHRHPDHRADADRAAAGRDRCASLGGVAASGSAAWVPLPSVAAGDRRRGLAADHLPGRPVGQAGLRTVLVRS